MSKNNKKLLNEMSKLDDRFIEEAEAVRFSAKAPMWKRMGALAAALILAAGIFTLPHLLEGNNEITHDPAGEALSVLVWDAKSGMFTYENGDLLGVGGAGNDLTANNSQEIATEPAIDSAPSNGEKPTLSPWQEYPFMTGEYENYKLSGGVFLAEDNKGELLGRVTMKGADEKTTNAEVYAIRSVDPSAAVAVKYEKTKVCFVFYNEKAEYNTLSELREAFSLASELYLGNALVTHNVATKTDTLSADKKLDALRAKLLTIDGTACTYDAFEKTCRDMSGIGFDLSHGALWKNFTEGMQIFEEGYIATNLGGILRIYKIGKDDALALIKLAEEADSNSIYVYAKDREILNNQTDAPIPGGNVNGSGGAYDPNAEIPETTADLSPYVPDSGITVPGWFPDTDTESAPASTLE